MSENPELGALARQHPTLPGLKSETGTTPAVFRIVVTASFLYCLYRVFMHEIGR
jgi:hypothetical protein